MLIDYRVLVNAFQFLPYSVIIHNYSQKWRWLVADVYKATNQWGKYPLLATDTDIE